MCTVWLPACFGLQLLDTSLAFPGYPAVDDLHFRYLHERRGGDRLARLRPAAFTGPLRPLVGQLDPGRSVGMLAPAIVLNSRHRPIRPGFPGVCAGFGR